RTRRDAVWRGVGIEHLVAVEPNRVDAVILRAPGTARWGEHVSRQPRSAVAVDVRPDERRRGAERDGVSGAVATAVDDRQIAGSQRRRPDRFVIGIGDEDDVDRSASVRDGRRCRERGRNRIDTLKSANIWTSLQNAGEAGAALVAGHTRRLAPG